MGVEKGTKAVISVDFSVYGEPTFNNLQTNFVVEIPEKSFSTATGCFDNHVLRLVPFLLRFRFSTRIEFVADEVVG